MVFDSMGLLAFLQAAFFLNSMMGASQGFSMRQNFPRFAFLSFAVTASLCIGCSNKPDWHAETYPVTGTVTINGSPPLNAFLVLHTTDGSRIDVRGTTPTAIIDEKGYFSFKTYEKSDGAPVGQFALTLHWPMSLTSPDAIDRLGEKFADPAKPLMNVDVIRGKNVIPPIDLKNVKVLPQK